MGVFIRRAVMTLRPRAPWTIHLRATQLSMASSSTQASCSASNSGTPAKETSQEPNQKNSKSTEEPVQKAKKKTMAELDEELRLKMEGRSGGGGSAGVEYENGKAEGLKRGVKDNMFRVI